MQNPDGSQSPRALSYTEMMNEGKQTRSDKIEKKNNGLEQRIEELERKVEHLQRVIQRQIMHKNKNT